MVKNDKSNSVKNMNNNIAMCLVNSAITHAINESVKAFQSVMCSISDLAAVMASVTDNEKIRETLTAMSKISHREWEQLAEITSSKIADKVDEIRKQVPDWLSGRYGTECDTKEETEMVIQEIRNAAEKTVDRTEDGRLRSMARVITVTVR